MSNFQVDLTNCDKEPIHIPGTIQSHGFLVGIDSGCFVRFFSDNIHTYLPELEEDLAGKSIDSLEQYFENSPNRNLISQVVKLGRLSGYEQINPYQINLRGKKYNLVISVSGSFELLEFEPEGLNAEMNVQKMIGKSVSEMLADKNLQNLLNNTARQVKKIIHYDRVMIYRFADDGHGEVVAEARSEELESWLGLHYPASDIPKQARELYKVNLTRLIADVDSAPARILADPSYSDPLDLTCSQLRAVSPIHIQYLKNMGVSSSFSISLIYKQELWGLVACHNYTPRFIDFKSRESAKLIGQILSSALEFRQDEENQLVQERFKEKIDMVTKSLQSNDGIIEALEADMLSIQELTQASAAALVHEREVTRIGQTPNDEQIRSLVAWAAENMTEGVFVSTNLAGVYPEAAAYQKEASGVLVVELTKELNEYVIWFKPERLQTINWAGNPEKPVEINESGMHQISPRHSFEIWSQNVQAHSDSWKAEELYSVQRLKEEVIYAINLKAGALRLLNEKLKAAYEELDSFSYTISHDLKNPIAAIKSYSQLLARSPALQGRDLEMANKITDRADKMNFMIGEVLDYSRIGRQTLQYQHVDAGALIGEIISELESIYRSRDLEVYVGETPVLQGDPMMISQVFSNLISNAVKYSSEEGRAKVTISGKETDSEVLYEISDNGLGIKAEDIPRIFELFNRLPSTAHIEGSGVGLAIVKRIVEKHKGRLWVESELGRGSSFFIAFRKLAATSRRT